MLRAPLDGEARPGAAAQASNKEKSYVVLAAKGRQVKSNLVPLAEEANEIAVQGVKPAGLAVDPGSPAQYAAFIAA